jgi:TonB family protein
MVGTLIESRAARARRTGGTLVSIAMHTGILGLAVVLTTRGTHRALPKPPDAVPVVYINPMPRQAPAPAPAPEQPQAVVPKVPALPSIAVPTVPPVKIPTELPTIDPSTIAPPTDWTTHPAAPVNTTGTGTGSGESSGPVNGVWDASAVDQAVSARAGNPAPEYPLMLRAAHVEGHVDVRFVVDTLGRAEPASIQVIASAHDRFSDAVRQAILHSRYTPAMAHGVRVRQLVEQRFEFELKR